MPADLRPVLAALLLSGAVGAWAVPFDDGKDAFARQDWKAAAAAFARVIAETPDSGDAPSAAFLRGVALYQAADFRGSLDAFQKLERTWPQSDYASRLAYWKGTAALSAGQNALAERELEAQTKVDAEPFTTRALLNLASARLALGKEQAAVAALDLFTKTSSEAALRGQAFALWGDVDRKAGRAEAALEHYRSASQAAPQSRWDVAARTQSVDLLIAASRWDEAAAALEGAVDAVPEPARWDPRRTVVARARGDAAALGKTLEAQWAREPDARKKQELASNRARLAEESGSPEALWWQRASVGPDVEVGRAAILRYAFLLEAAQPLQAAQALESWARGTAVVQEEVLSRAAQDRWVAGDAKGALATWDRLLASPAKSARVPEWLLGRGQALLAGGDTGKSLSDLSRLLKDYPKAAQAPEARYQTGLVYLKRQEPARAEAWFFGLVQELGSGDLYQRALLARGISFVNAGKTDLARSSLERLLREVPNGVWVGDAWSALGRNALQAGLYEEAASAFAQAEQTQKGDAQAAALWSRAEALAARSATVDSASAEFARYARTYAPRAGEAVYRQGAVYLPGKAWDKALEIWGPLVDGLKGSARDQTREGMAQSLLRLNRPEEGWTQLETLEAVVPSPDAWYRWGLTASSLGQGDWAVKAFQYLLQHHPASAAAEAALPRAAGALLGGGHPEEALSRYADYFLKYGRQPSSAPVARSAGAAALAYPAVLESLVKASRGWNLAPEVAAEFNLVWAQSRLDTDPVAETELQTLSRTAPWSAQRSEALWMLGRWQLANRRLPEARTLFEAASGLGDDVSQFKGRVALAQVTEAEGDFAAAARQRETAEKAAGPGVPVEFRVQTLRDAAAAWTKAGRGEEAQRVQKRVDQLSS